LAEAGPFLHSDVCRLYDNHVSHDIPHVWPVALFHVVLHHLYLRPVYQQVQENDGLEAGRRKKAKGGEEKQEAMEAEVEDKMEMNSCGRFSAKTTFSLILLQETGKSRKFAED
jgi:hypothetical protein